MNEKYFWIGLVALIALGPFVGQNYVLHVLILCFIWSMVVAGWDLVMGYAGIVNFAQLVFFAAGAYASAMIAISLDVPPLEAIFITAIIVAFVGLLIGLPCLRLRGEYVALFTFAVHLALPSLIRQGRPWGTGGSTGLMGIPPFEIGGYTLRTIDKLPWYYLTLTLAAIAIYTIYFVVLPRKWGRAFVCIRDSEAFARSLGVNDYKYKLLVFMVSAAITGSRRCDLCPLYRRGHAEHPRDRILLDRNADALRGRDGPLPGRRVGRLHHHHRQRALAQCGRIPPARPRCGGPGIGGVLPQRPHSALCQEPGGHETRFTERAIEQS